MEKLSVPILLGTNRKDRKSEQVANWLLEVMQRREDLNATLFDVREFDLPKDDYGTVIKDFFPKWRDAISAADGLIIIAPEYNHGYPGILKSVLDLLLKEYIHKAVGLVGVSAGPWGGTKVVEQLVGVVRELGLTVTFTDLNFAKVQEVFDENGKIKNPEKYEKRAKSFLDELVWMSSALRWGRANLK